MNQISILDPTCGSGAFLFASLNVLEPFYLSCLEAMEGFLDDLKHTKRKHAPDQLVDFRKVLQRVADHRSRQYFVLKSIIVNNLYGVDIMNEATEICKLRLFLKLMAQIENFDEIEPLPDIDFNIRSGNTVVGFVSKNHLSETLESDIVKKMSLPYLEERTKDAERAFYQFRATQIEHPIDVMRLEQTKSELRNHLEILRSELNTYLAGDYGVDSQDLDSYALWQKAHQPFHWLVEFHEIMRSGGFDVVIGNPPYISSPSTRLQYDVKDLKCHDCPDAYAWFLERNQSLLRDGGRSGMIVPLSVGFHGKFDICRKLLFQNYAENWFSSYGRIPSALFSFSVRVRNTIHLGFKARSSPRQYTTRLHRWFEVARPFLFEQLKYTEFQPERWGGRIPKINTTLVGEIFEGLRYTNTNRVSMQLSPSQTSHVLHFKKTAYNWLNFCRTLPPCYNDKGIDIPHTKFGSIFFPDEESFDLNMLLLNGKLMLIYWFIVADDFDVTRWNFEDLPFDCRLLADKYKLQLRPFVSELEKAMIDNTQFKRNAKKKIGNYNLAKCREVTDRSDRIFLEAFGIEKIWEDVELYYTQTVRTNFRIPETNE